MRMRRSVVLSLIAGALCLAGAAAWLISRNAGSEQLVGTWLQISATYDGKASPGEDGATYLMHITPTQWVSVVYSKTSRVVALAGGHYVLSGNEFRETTEYLEHHGGAFEPMTRLMKLKLEGNRLTLTGKDDGTTFELVYEREAK